MAIPEADLALARKKKWTAGICGILAGGFAVHKFVLGYSSTALMQLILTVFIFGSVMIGGMVMGVPAGTWFLYGSLAAGMPGLIEGVIYLTKSDEDFFKIYIRRHKNWF